MIISLVAVAAAAGCGGELTPTGTAPSPTGDAEPGSLQGVGTVIETGGAGARLCFSVMTSLPPQCGAGPELVGWSWDDVEGDEEQGGTTWGEYAVTGTWDGERFTVTDVGRPEDAVFPSTPDPYLGTPCDEPEGGWQVVDAATTTDETLQAALAAAQVQPDYAGAWLDQSINPASGEGISAEEQEQPLNDPTKLVLNVRFTGDVERHEAELRTTWGGALCVSEGGRSEAELLDLQAELTDDPRVLGSSPDVQSGQLEVQVVADDGLQTELDETYGAGIVAVVPALVPLS